MKKILVIAIATLAVLLTSCDNRAAEFEHFFERDEQPAISNNGSPNHEANEPANANENGEDAGNHEDDISRTVLEGELTVLAGTWDDEMHIYAEMFTAIHPDVTINIERLTAPPGTDSLAQQLAMITGLLADPPDLFLFRSRFFNFEKSVNERLFVDLYELFDGPRGISMENYFSNIFTATEVQGGLYSVPLFVELMLAFPNKYLFESAGIDISEITSVSIDDEIGYYMQIAPLFPERTIYPSPWFSIWRVFERSLLYDMDSGEVFANTPEMYERVRMAVDTPISSWVEIRNNRGLNWTGLGIYDQFVPSDYIFYEYAMGGMNTFAALFLQEHPNFQFAKPIPFSIGDGHNVPFESFHSLSIMRESPNVELAWEFMRFILEYEESLAHVWSYYRALTTLPINRNRFNNQVYDVLQGVFDETMHFTDLKDYIAVSIGEFRARQIENAMRYITSLMESVNIEHVVDFAPFDALVLPEIWRIHTGQQTIERGLYNIQNRLELYVHE